MTMNNIASVLGGVKTAAIAGHIRPDGDCTGSCLSLYNYIKENYTHIEVDLYLEEPAAVFRYLKGFDEIKNTCEGERVYDVFFALDSGDKERIGVAAEYFETAEKTVCVDHHISNKGYADVNVIVPGLSSTAELLYEMYEEDKISKETAEAIYTAMVHDTGVFRYTSTTKRTLEIAGKLVGKGIAFTDIIDKTFYEKTYLQNQILGRALLESILFMDGRCICSVIKKKDMDFYNVTSNDLDGIVSQLNSTAGVEVALFLYEVETQEYKVSMRSKDIVDVSEVAAYFGGGGHIRAAGCTMVGSAYDVINNLSRHIEKQLLEKCSD